MRRRLAIAAVLGVVLLATVALAYEWLWLCPFDSNQGTAYYNCPEHGVFSTWAYGTDQRAGPPDRRCSYCNATFSADSAKCTGTAHHTWYAPSWGGY